MSAATNVSGHLVPGGGRDLEALKREVQRRADLGMPPLTGIRAEDARAALARIDDLDRDAWARAFSAIAENYEQEGQVPAAHERSKAASAWWNAWRLHHFARWPTENAPAKVLAKERALSAFRNYVALLEPPIERVRISSRDGEIVGYLRLPEARPAPLVFGIAGLDSRKEDVIAHSDAYLRRGIGIFALDLPGTGESPVSPATPESDRIFSAALDALTQRAEIDARRIVVQGRSWSGYWAAKLAITERNRLRGSVMHGGPIHHYFEREWLARSLGTGEYLYDYLEAKCAMFGGDSLESMIERAQRYSLLASGLLDQPNAPMLLVNGAQDTQIPISDLFLLLQHGDAKEAWVNPRGGHMGRSADWPAPAIAEKVLMPWIVRRMRAED
ncbi:MAG: alpha/beta hydrolase family protein [Burkholderiales bacterium]